MLGITDCATACLKALVVPIVVEPLTVEWPIVPYSRVGTNPCDIHVWGTNMLVANLACVLHNLAQGKGAKLNMALIYW